MLEINNTVAEDVLTRFIRDFVRKNGFSAGIIGVSGGLDSAVVLALTARALESENTRALLMPYRLSSGESLEHGRLLCDRLNVEYEVVNISGPVDRYLQENPTDSPLQIGNLCARTRMMALFDYSQRHGALVIGTSNKSELLIGYSTIYGDSAAAALPIGDLYKTQVFDLARHLEIPAEIVEKKPSADLWKDQTDESEIGMSYCELDKILFLRVDQGMKTADIIKKGFAAGTVRRVEHMIVNSQYKRMMPPIPKLQKRTIGIDFRYLRDWNR